MSHGTNPLAEIIKALIDVLAQILYVVLQLSDFLEFFLLLLLRQSDAPDLVTRPEDKRLRLLRTIQFDKSVRIPNLEDGTFTMPSPKN